jgi:hypothetical protein
MDEIWTYLGNQLGFSETGRIILYQYIVPRIKAIGLEVFEPFTECAKGVDFASVGKIPDYEGRVRFWKEFNTRVGLINKKGMKKSRIMSPVLDGGPALDDGVGNEIGHYTAKGYGRIIALRTDFRLSENLGAIINPQIESDIFETEGRICTTMDEWYAELEREYKRLKGKCL